MVKKQLKHKKKICATCGEGTVTDQTCQKSLAKVRAVGFSLDDAPWLGRPVEVDNYQIKTLIENSQCCIPHGRLLTYSKNPNQVLKIICTGLIMFITFIFGFHVS